MGPLCSPWPMRHGRLADKARIESLETENQRLQACLKTQEDLHRKKVRR